MWWIAVVRIRICRIVRIYRIVTMRCIVITLTFDSSPIKGEGDWRLGCLVVAPRCGYCLEASMTTTLPFPSGLRIKFAMTCRAHQCEFHNPVD